jgi:8-amino-7-oxononanoate synthase
LTDVQERRAEFRERSLLRRPRMVSGPQGPRVVLDGKPVLLLCSDNSLGLADHPRVREAAADAAMRWGVGAGAPRPVAGTMTVHRRLEERLAAFQGTEAAVLFGSGYLAAAGVLGALAGEGALVLSDEHNHAAIVDACRMAGAETFVYGHGDADHLAWGLRHARGRSALIVTDAVFALDGDVAPLEEIADLAARHRVRLVVDESHGIGTLGPGGRGAVHAAGVEDDVDVVMATLGGALGSYGAFAACDGPIAQLLAGAARTYRFSTAPPPPSAAGALAALELLGEQPQRVDRLRANATALRDELAREGFDVLGSGTHIVPLVIGDDEPAARVADLALERGVFVEAGLPPRVEEGMARLRLAVMASHTREELRDAARALGRAALRAGFRPAAGVPAVAAREAAARPFDGEADVPRAA